jgi:hypothetical protein
MGDGGDVNRFETYLTDLTKSEASGVFARLAEEAAQSADAAAAFADLEQLLERALAARAGTADGEARSISLSQLIDAYVDKVWPARQAAGLDKGHAETLAAQYGVVNSLGNATIYKIRQPWQFIDLSDEEAAETPADAADEAGKDGDADASAKRQDGAVVVPKAPVRKQTSNMVADSDLQEICDAARAAMANGERILVMLGFATAGKTFFVRRLAETCDGYGVTDIRGGPITAGQITDRTKGVVIYRLETLRKGKPNFTILDLPGEYFKAFARISTDQAEEERQKMCAVLAVADMCIVIEPAMHVLAEDDFIANGDCTTEGLIDDFLADKAKMKDPGRPAGHTDFEWAAQLAYDAREETIENLRLVPQLLPAMTKRIVHLRDTVRASIKAGDLEQTRDCIKNYAETSEVERPDTRAALPIPGLLLLSRTDDYLARTRRPGGGDPCADPALALRLTNSRRLDIYSDAFCIFGVDFISANIPPPGARGDRRAFNPGWDHSGIAGLIDDWIMPAIRRVADRSGKAKPRAARKSRAFGFRSVFDKDFRKKAAQK